MNAIKVAVIIPYFQTERGLLGAALASVAAQNLSSGVAIDIIVVDDGSPRPAEEEIGIAMPAHCSLRIIKQRNAGVSGARNKGLDEVSKDTQYIAFLDSDDTWLADHISSALNFLQRDTDFYFDNNIIDQDIDAFSHNKFIERCKKNRLINIDGCAIIGADQFFLALLEECIPHTSQVVVKKELVFDLRFSERFRRAGEDHLFFLMICQKSSNIGFCTKVMGIRGKGVSIYRETLAWDSKNGLNRLIDEILLHDSMISEFHLTVFQRQIVKNRLNKIVGQFVFIAARMAFRRPEIAIRALLRLAICSPASLRLLPSAAINIRKHRASMLGQNHEEEL